MDYTVHGILQARVLEWVAIPFSRGSSQPRHWTQRLNLGLPHCRQILYQLRQREAPGAGEGGVKLPEWRSEHQSQIRALGLPWWPRGQETAFRYRGRRFNPWSGKIPHTTESLALVPWLSLPTMTTGTHAPGEAPTERIPLTAAIRQPLLTAARKSLLLAVKTAQPKIKLVSKVIKKNKRQRGLLPQTKWAIGLGRVSGGHYLRVWSIVLCKA